MKKIVLIASVMLCVFANCNNNPKSKEDPATIQNEEEVATPVVQGDIAQDVTKFLNALPAINVTHPQILIKSYIKEDQPDTCYYSFVYVEKDLGSQIVENWNSAKQSTSEAWDHIFESKNRELVVKWINEKMNQGYMVFSKFDPRKDEFGAIAYTTNVYEKLISTVKSEVDSLSKSRKEIGHSISRLFDFHNPK